MLSVCQLRRYVISIVLLFSSGLATWAEGALGDDRVPKADGPYLIYQDDGSVRVISIDSEGTLIDTVFNAGLPEGHTLQVSDQNGRYAFDVELHRPERPHWNFPQARKTFVMSDPHGRLDLMADLLMAHGVIDEDLHWSFGKNHLVVLGDVFDRGTDVTQILWLLYRLDREAYDAGGRMTFVLGNHETMVLAGDLRYVDGKYDAVARKTGITIPELYGRNTELGRWLATRNTVEKAGRYLLVHAGIGPDMLEESMSVAQINDAISEGLFLTKAQRKADPQVRKLFGNPGPLWYRGLALDDEKYSPASQESMDDMLECYDAETIIVGHTMMDDVTLRYSGRVVTVNVDNEYNRDNSTGRAIMIKGRRIYLLGNDRIIKRLK